MDRIANGSLKRAADMLPPPLKRIKFSNSPPRSAIKVFELEKAEKERLATEKDLLAAEKDRLAAEVEEQRRKLEEEKNRLQAEMEKMKAEKDEVEAEQQRRLEEMQRREAENRETMKKKEEENLFNQKQILDSIQTEKERFVDQGLYLVFSNNLFF